MYPKLYLKFVKIALILSEFRNYANVGYCLKCLIYCGFEWSGQPGSNRRHQAWEAIMLLYNILILLNNFKVLKNV